LAVRSLTQAEWTELSDGLAVALQHAGVEPLIEDRAHPAAFLGALRFGSQPVMAIGRTIWWPRAKENFAGSPLMAVLQHELQHLLDYAEKRLSVIGYLLGPRHWTYRYDLSQPLDWNRLGAEQRASLAEDLWCCERGLGPRTALNAIRDLIPWAQESN
jgi:hypothetical protein